MNTHRLHFSASSLKKKEQNRLSDFLQFLSIETNHFLGYPISREFDYSPLYPFFNIPLNNVGDPFLESRYHANSHQYEREVIAFFSALLHAKKNDVWGYVTNGGTEGNMYGIYLAREVHPDGLLYYSEATHYSVPKILRMVHARSIMIKSQTNGEMDYQDLAETLRIHADVPAIIFANIGTTMTGAIDDIRKISRIIKDLDIRKYYIHCDAALSGMILPFVNNPPDFDFASGIDSISISGHKMIGSPIPCGLVLAKKTHVDCIARAVEYIGTLDTTVTGSRNGITPLFLWYAIHCKGKEGFAKTCQHCFSIADYAIKRFDEINIKAWRNPNSITVVFPKQSENVLEKWQIAIQKECAHIIAMPHVSSHQIDQFIDDLNQDIKQQVA
ncbi:MAG: histidine decarboxylase [Methylococcales symbiont of Hymedesmia sp. n. MRB-2018]|nr:MAG: histidine decarboxylase [Methylococcales symbiont of Hymedesmia sp. n. MRB-2018]KAF3984472.1 MAG: histidine decarboxylase [Methylococcales symbiont of Hymedesmia sp. n. MRB-2018]